MRKVYSFGATGNKLIKDVLKSSSRYNMDCRRDFDKLKEITSESFEKGEYEVDLFRPKLIIDNSNNAISRKGLLKKFPLSDDGWRFGTLEHLVDLMSQDYAGLINEAAGIPIVAINSYDDSSHCPVLHTYFFDANGFLLDLNSAWFLSEMPCFLRLRKV